MKKIILIISLLFLVGCGPVTQISEKLIKENLVVEEITYIPSYKEKYFYARGGSKTVPATYRTILKDSMGIEYILTDYENYCLCKDKEGEEIIGYFKLFEYSDKSLKKELIKIEPCL